ncbi:MAG: VWA domain-containing protein [Pseudomonadota bacterium]
MIEFLWIWAFLLLPLPYLVRRVLPPAGESRSGALRVPFFGNLNREFGKTGNSKRHRWNSLFFLSLIWIALVTAAARPTFVGEPMPIPTEGRDLMMAIDLSGSMGRQDFSMGGIPADRLTVVKDLANDFIARREGDRVGLILFGTRAYLQTPVTFDRTTVQAFLDDSHVGLTGEETAIGDAIGLAVKRLKDRPSDSRVLVLLTDGASNAGVLDPRQAAQLAADEGLRIYTIGVGADQIATNGTFGRAIVNPSMDLDEAALQDIAQITGGAYFRARNLEGLANIYREIDRLEPTSGEPQYLRPTKALFYWPLGIGLLLSLALGVTKLWPASLTLGTAWRT